MTQAAADRVDDPFEEFNRAMGADGDASPYERFVANRAAAAIEGGVSVFSHFEVMDAEAPLHL